METPNGWWSLGPAADWDLVCAGEPVGVVAEEFGLSRDEVEDAIRVATRPAA
jgi:hypothetical protein